MSSEERSERVARVEKFLNGLYDDIEERERKERQPPPSTGGKVTLEQVRAAVRRLRRKRSEHWTAVCTRALLL